MEGKLYDLDYLNSISGGDQDFVKDMIITFIENVPEELNKIRNLIASKNWPKVGEDAHKFASSLLFLGLDNLKLIATRIEEHGLSGENVDQIPVLIDQLETGCRQIIIELKQDFNV
jgi:HPt (histidine-containing phosphotransfer) domain-containing protein